MDKYTNRRRRAQGTRGFYTVIHVSGALAPPADILRETQAGLLYITFLHEAPFEALPVKSNTWEKNLTCHKEPMRSRTMTAIWTCGSLPFIYRIVPSKIITLHMSYHIKEVSLCSAGEGEALWNLIWKEHISPVHQDHSMLCANIIISRAFLQKKKELIE